MATSVLSCDAHLQALETLSLRMCEQFDSKELIAIALSHPSLRIYKIDGCCNLAVLSCVRILNFPRLSLSEFVMTPELDCHTIEEWNYLENMFDELSLCWTNWLSLSLPRELKNARHYKTDRNCNVHLLFLDCWLSNLLYTKLLLDKEIVTVASSCNCLTLRSHEIYNKNFLDYQLQNCCTFFCSWSYRWLCWTANCRKKKSIRPSKVSAIDQGLYAIRKICFPKD